MMPLPSPTDVTRTASTKPRKRCAVYCRVSTDERLDQEFNSIDAQREAGHAYIASQRAEGWIPVPDDYDDGGFSGGNTERPALRRLMADIEAGRVDMVVIYKIDRLTRSLVDFCKMVEVFNERGVAFVSVTQDFNTSTPMGRLMLNVLLSFAQFEREQTSERIRDKIAASKKKGLWTGGTPPLGYDVVAKKLEVNEAEATIVRRMFEEMLTIGSPTRIVERLNAEGVTTKAWTTKDKNVRAGTPMDKKFIHALLRNRIYLGELLHRGQWYPAVHAPIIDRELWDKVHAVLERNAHQRAGETKTRERTDALLRGLLFASSGEPMYPTYATKNGRQYRYYVSKSESRFGAPAKRHARISGPTIEAAVVAQIRATLSSPECIEAVVRHVQRIQPAGVRIDEASVVMAMARLGDTWERLFPAEQHRIAKLMVERVDLIEAGDAQGIKVKWRELGWNELIGEFAPDAIGAELLEVEA